MTIEELKSNFPDLAQSTEKEEPEQKEGEVIDKETAQMIIGSLIANLADTFRMKPG